MGQDESDPGAERGTGVVRTGRPGPMLYGYFIREAILPISFALFGLTLVVLANDLVRLMPLASRGVASVDIAIIAGFKAVPMLATMIPFSTMVGLLIALGRLSADQEILALDSCGVPTHRLAGPAFLVATALALPALWLQTTLVPWAHRGQQETWERVAIEQPWARIQAQSLTRFGSWQIYARSVSADRKHLEHVLLWTEELDETVFARRAEIVELEGQPAHLMLLEGAILDAGRNSPRRISFDSMRAELPSESSPLERKATDDPIRALSFSALRAEAALHSGTGEQGATPYLLEMHRRFAAPASTALFGLLAVPLFMTRRSHSRSSGGVIGLLATLAYYAVAQMGEGVVEVLGTPTLGAWLPNLTLLIVALALLWRGVARSNGQPERSRPVRKARRSTAGPSQVRRYALHRYVGRRYLETAAMSFAVIFVAYLLIDFVGRIDWFAQHDATSLEVLRYYSARIWMLFANSAPMALLVGTGLTVSLLAAEGELLGMRACGIQAPKALASVMILSLLAVPVYFLLINVVTPRMAVLQDEVKIREIYGRSLDFVASRPVWYPTGNKLVESMSLATDRGVARTGLTVYDLGEDGLPTARTDATSGFHLGHGLWQLENAQRIELGADGIPYRVPASPYVQFDTSFAADLDTSHLTLDELSEAIERAGAEELDSSELEVEYHTRLARPLSCFLLPLVVLLYAVGGTPLPRPSATLSASVAIGVGYVLVTGFTISLGYGRTLSPIVAAWAPNMLFGVLAVLLGWRVWART